MTLQQWIDEAKEDDINVQVIAALVSYCFSCGGHTIACQIEGRKTRLLHWCTDCLAFVAVEE